MPEKKLHGIVICRRKGVDQLVNAWQLFVVIRDPWKNITCEYNINYPEIIASNQMIVSVCWIKNGTLVLKCAYWWLRRTYWSGWRGKGAREALEKTTWALQWWREHPPTDHPPGPVPLWTHSTCTSHYSTAGGSVVHNVDLHRLRNVLYILKSHAGFTVIGLVT